MLRLCVPSTGGSAAGIGRKVLAVPHPVFAVRVVAIQANMNRAQGPSYRSDLYSELFYSLSQLSVLLCLTD